MLVEGRRAKPCLTIWIEDSPRLTCTMSSPGSSLPITRSRLKRAGRAGGVRIAMHRKWRTKVFDFWLPGECGWQAMLKAANINPNQTNVCHLRNVAARAICNARLADRPIQGIFAHDVLRAEQIGLNQYCSNKERHVGIKI